MGKIKNTRTPFNVDLGVGDIIVPKSEKRVIPVQLDEFTKPEISTYSLESTIAEKFDAILQLLEMTSRMKDFYDIYELHGGKYDSTKLAAYFKWMLELRAKIALKDATTDYLDKQFVEKHLELWQAIGKKYRSTVRIQSSEQLPVFVIAKPSRPGQATLGITSMARRQSGD